MSHIGTSANGPEKHSRPTIEYRKFPTPHAITIDVTKDLRVRTKQGPVVILADRPLIFYALLRRQWMRQARLMLLERARTVDPEKVAGFTNELNRMRELEFTLDPAKAPTAVVTVLTFSEWLEFPPNYHAIYICQPLSDDQRHTLLRSVSAKTTIIVYAEQHAKVT